jgi:hypothetical protein
VPNWRTYSPATRAALAVLSQGSCYYPGCGTPIVVLVGGQPEVNVERVRIRTANAHGPRYVAGMSEDAENSFDNLLLLCVPHRKMIDRDERAHPADLLETWKSQRETSGQSALRDLSALLEHEMDELLTSAFAMVQEQISDALARFEKTDPDSAELVRQLVARVNEQRSRNGGDFSRLDALADRVDELVRKLESKPKRLNIGWSS